LVVCESVVKDTRKNQNGKIRIRTDRDTYENKWGVECMPMNETIQTIETQFATYKRKRVYCGKKGCSRCPHGPYWYAEVRVSRGRDKKGKYLGSRIKEIYIGRDFRYLNGDQGATRDKHHIRSNADIILSRDLIESSEK